MAAPKGNKYAAGNKGGRGGPPKYNPKFAQMATKACQAGFTDREVAELLGVSEVAIYQWKLKHEDFALAMRVGKAPADERVVSSLYHRAVGYTYDSVKIFLDRDTKKPIYASYREHVPPDVAACLRWLMVRRPHEWRERQDHTHRIDDKRTAAELFAELQAEAAERSIKLIASDEGTFEPVEAGEFNGKTED